MLKINASIMWKRETNHSTRDNLFLLSAS